MSTNTEISPHTVAASGLAGIAASMKAAWSAHRKRVAHKRAIAHMHCLTDRDLADIGVSRWQIEDAVTRGRNAVRQTGPYWL